MPERRKLAAYKLPFAAFLALLALNGALKKIDNLFWLSSAEYGLASRAADGILYNGVAYRTRSLSSYILTHAVTNLLLGLWIMKTKQWGLS